MAAAIHLPPGFIVRRWRSLSVLLLAGMAMMTVVAGALGYVLLGCGILGAMLVGAALSPTDPVLASTIVTGQIAEKNIPARLRFLLYAESAANDGLAYPLVYLAILLLRRPMAEALPEWLLKTVFWEVILAALIGAATGWLFGRFQIFSERRNLSESTGLTAVTLALALFLLGAIKLFGGDGILGVFAAGVAFHWVSRDALEREQDAIHDMIQRFFQLPAFILLGVLLPWSEWGALGGWGMVFGLAVLLLRRVPALLLLRPGLPEIRNGCEALFAGWYGPIGVAAVFYALLARRETGLDWIWPIGALVVTLSTIIHGLSATPGTHWLGRMTPEAEKESES